MKTFLFALAGTSLLAACGGEPPRQEGQVSGEEVAEKLEEAADQSDPRAEEVLEDAADEAEDRESLQPVDEAGSFAQEAMRKAGEAQASPSPN